MVVEGAAVIIVGAAVVIVRGAIEWLSESNGVLAVEERKLVVGGWVEWKGRGSRGKGRGSNRVIKWDGYARRWWLKIRGIGQRQYREWWGYSTKGGKKRWGGDRKRAD